jgi:putative FmdB family regulatory protein
VGNDASGLFIRSLFSMPTYEYQCEKCGLIFEEFQSITAPPLTICKKEGCGGSVKKLFSPGAGFLFKGSGFYSTDYRSESYKKQAKADSGAAPAAPSGDSKGGASSSSTGSSTPTTPKA